ncbi:SART-1 protein [Dendryphion nanum]|uniref:SART-1 protein n=1 Tax=Dendryphion nanum TaxID=256645 RepID=A0A9P9IEL8_9PLEO|nr:SART-1 protein [Dendryphion nanum]
MGDLALSIEEANKVRIAMGMAPLPVPGAAPASSGPTFKESRGDSDSDDDPASTFETRQAAAEDNWIKLQDEAQAKKKREQRAANIRKERERAQRSAKLDGVGLADEINDEDDRAWLKASKKRQKKIAKAEQIQKEFEERERQEREALQYTEADLAGVKVGHEVKSFEDGEDQILVLKDTAVDADEDDELEAVSLREKERLQERLDSKKRKRAYDPNDVDEAGHGSILAQYDEEIDGKKRTAFTLDGKGKTVEALQAEASAATRPKKVAISLDILNDDTPANDYMDVSEVKIKKPKKKKSKASRRKRVEEDEDIFPAPDEDAPDDMDVDEPQPIQPKPKKNFFDTSFVDDDDLQANLAAQRQKALKKRKKVRPEDLARQLREEALASPDVRETTEADDSALVIDETTEFVQNLERSKSEDAEEENRRKRQKSSHARDEDIEANKSVDGDGDIEMNQSYADVANADDRPVSHEHERSVHITGTGLEEEETIDRGLGATLKLLKQRGVVQESDGADLTSQYRQRQKFLADKQRAEEDAERFAKDQRERERDSTRWNQMSAREREEWSRKNNVNRDHMTSRRMAEIFNKEYKPNIQLNYVDDHGRHMNQKEAFKQLSHQFHGKGSGNTKTQKHLDKIAAERKKESESALETTLAGGISNAQGQQSKKHKQAGVRLQ